MWGQNTSERRSEVFYRNRCTAAEPAEPAERAEPAATCHGLPLTATDCRPPPAATFRKLPLTADGFSSGEGRHQRYEWPPE